MKLVIKDGLVIASHQNNQDIKGLYNDQLEMVRVPDNTVLQTISPPPTDFNNPVSIGSNSISYSLPADPRLNWNLEASKEKALLVLDDIAEEYRAKILSAMPGRIAGYEVKARVAARIIESENPNQADIDSLKLEADNRGITVLELAKIISKRSEEFATVSIYIDGESQRIKAVIQSAENTKGVWDFLKTFEENIINKIGG